MAFGDRNGMTDRAMAFAMTLSPDIVAVRLHHLEGPGPDEGLVEIQRRWRSEIVEPLARLGRTAPRMVAPSAPHREIHGPLLEFIDIRDAGTPDRSVVVLIPELVLTRWWERPLHVRRAPRLNVITAPWRR